jgi:hypothetical protein
MADLFDLTDLAALVQGDLDTATAVQCRDIATGVVLSLTGRSVVPDLVPQPMAAVGKRIAAKLYENPTGLTVETLAPYSATFGALVEDLDRLILKPFSLHGVRAGSSRTRECRDLGVGHRVVDAAPCESQPLRM